MATHLRTVNTVWHGWGSVSDPVARYLWTGQAQEQERRALDYECRGEEDEDE